MTAGPLCYLFESQQPVVADSAVQRIKDQIQKVAGDSTIGRLLRTFQAPETEVRRTTGAVESSFDIARTPSKITATRLGASLDPLDQNRLLNRRTPRQPIAYPPARDAGGIPRQSDTEPIVQTPRLQALAVRVQAAGQQVGWQLLQPAAPQRRLEIVPPGNQQVDVLRELRIRRLFHQM